MRRALLFLVALLLLALELPATAAISLSVTSHSHYTDAVGLTHIVGEVQNTGTSNAAYVEIFFDFRDSSGTVVDTDYAQTTASVLGPGASSPFHEVFSPPAGSTYSVVGVQGEMTTRQPNRNFDVVITDTFEESGKEHTVGQVTNRNTTAASYIFVILTFRGPDGAVVDADYALVDGGASLKPGQSASFDSTRPADAPAYSTRSVFADSTTPPSPSSAAPVATPTPTPTYPSASPAPSPSPTAPSPSPTASSPSPTLPSPEPSGSTGPTGQPLIERTASLSLRRHLVARGEINAGGYIACLQQVTVKIQRKRPSGWRTVATTTTTLEGVFRKRVPDRRGRYRAVAIKILTSELVCSRAISPIRRHRH